MSDDNFGKAQFKQLPKPMHSSQYMIHAMTIITDLFLNCKNVACDFIHGYMRMNLVSKAYWFEKSVFSWKLIKSTLFFGLESTNNTNMFHKIFLSLSYEIVRMFENWCT